VWEVKERYLPGICRLRRACVKGQEKTKKKGIQSLCGSALSLLDRDRVQFKMVGNVNNSCRGGREEKKVGGKGEDIPPDYRTICGPRRSMASAAIRITEVRTSQYPKRREEKLNWLKEVKRDLLLTPGADQEANFNQGPANGWDETWRLEERLDGQRQLLRKKKQLGNERSKG